MTHNMSKKIPLRINGWIYNIHVDDEFASYLKEKVSKDFNRNIYDTRKAIIHAYINANYELFKQEQEIENIANKLAENLPSD